MLHLLCFGVSDQCASSISKSNTSIRISRLQTAIWILYFDCSVRIFTSYMIFGSHLPLPVRKAQILIAITFYHKCSAVQIFPFFSTFHIVWIRCANGTVWMMGLNPTIFVVMFISSTENLKKKSLTSADELTGKKNLLWKFPNF